MTDFDQELPTKVSEDMPSWDAAVGWLVQRLTTVIEEGDEDDDEIASQKSSIGEDGVEHEQEHEHGDRDEQLSNLDTGSSFTKLQSYPARKPVRIADSEPPWAGYNGRTNKVADTCYVFWVSATLKVSLTLQ